MSGQIDSPYINTKLCTNVPLYPNQMNNNVYINLKKNLTEAIERKNFNNYGYIVRVFEILTYDNNRIEAENTMAAATFDVKFSCRICRPLKNTKIICQVERLNKVLLRLKNGPINVIVTNDRINPSVFIKDDNRNLRYIDKKNTILLAEGDFVKVNIIQITFHSKGDHIVAIGFLDNMATTNEIKTFYKDAYENKDEFIEFDEYLKLQQKTDTEVEKKDT
jgi:DNA-directed RNA polymerase subunit E'/Rpb7